MLSEARAFYNTFPTDATVEAEVRDEAEALAREIFLNSGADGVAVDGAAEITSATVNGQSFAGTRSMTKGQRLKMLRAVIKMYDAGGAISSRGYFKGPA